MIGIKCPMCLTTVKPIISEDIEPILWFRRPEGVAKLINPAVWTMLSDRFSRSGFNIVQWIADTKYKPNVREPVIFKKILESNIPRGYNNFVENFDLILKYLFENKRLSGKIQTHDYLKRLLEEKRHAIFSDYIPLPNKSILVIEKTNTGTYVDKVVLKAIDAIEMVTSIDSGIMPHTIRTKENRTIRALITLADFYTDFYKESISAKNGQFRKHVFGTRTNFNFRAVISSLTDEHVYDEIYVPWAVGLTAFRPHLLNKLMKRGYELNSAIGLLFGHVEKFHPMLDELLKELINETQGGRGIITMEQRNPTLLSGSAQIKRITKFKEDPTDHTVSTSILTMKAPNADCDGDALNYSIGLDNFLSELWKPLEPHNNILLADIPRTISENISISKPVISTISNWLSSEEPVEEEKIRKMQILI